MLSRTAFLALLALAACAADTTILLASFDTSCVHDQDCVVVEVGDICGCDCGNAAINRSGLAVYQSELADKGTHCHAKVFCGCPATGPATCVAGKCVFKGP